MFKEYPDVVSVEQLMEMLQIGQSLAYRLLRSGAIPAKRVGRKYIIAKVNVIEFVCGSCKEAA